MKEYIWLHGYDGCELKDLVIYRIQANNYEEAHEKAILALQGVIEDPENCKEWIALYDKIIKVGDIEKLSKIDWMA